MAFLAQVDAIILDLRDNHGGNGGVGVLLDSYLFRGADPSR
jgi:C-terminal processing protease CtpA/Prc